MIKVLLLFCLLGFFGYVIGGWIGAAFVVLFPILFIILFMSIFFSTLSGMK